MADPLIVVTKTVNPRKQRRQEGAAARKADYDLLTAKQKLDALDAKLGVGVGAVKQRARLLKPAAPAIVIKAAAPAVITKPKKEKSARKYLAPGSPQSS